GVGLNRLAPDAARRANDAEADAGVSIALEVERSAQRDAPLSFLDLLGRYHRRDRQILGVDLEQGQHLVQVSGDALGDEWLLVAWHRYLNGRGIVGEIE